MMHISFYTTLFPRNFQKNHFPQASLSKIVDVALKMLKPINEMMAPHTIQGLIGAFYGARIPLYYLEYFVHDRRSDTALNMVGNLLNFFSDLGNGLLWYQELEIVDLGQIAKGYGVVTLFRGVNVFYIGAYTLFGANAAISLAKGKLSQKEKALHAINLAISVFQVGLTVLFISNCLSFPAMILVSTLSGGGSFVAWAIRTSLIYDAKSAPS